MSKQIEYSNSPQNTPLKDGLGRWRYPAFWYNVTQVSLRFHKQTPVKMDLQFVQLLYCVDEFIRGNDWGLLVMQTVLIPHSGGKTVTLEFLIFDSNIGLLPPILEVISMLCHEQNSVVIDDELLTNTPLAFICTA